MPITRSGIHYGTQGRIHWSYTSLSIIKDDQYAIEQSIYTFKYMPGINSYL